MGVFQPEQKLELNDQEIGEAICSYIGTFKFGVGVFPYRIKRCSAPIPKKIEFTLEIIPKGTKLSHFPV